MSIEKLFITLKNTNFLNEKQRRQTKVKQKFKKCQKSKNFQGNIDSVDYEDLNSDNNNYDFC